MNSTTRPGAGAIPGACPDCSVTVEDGEDGVARLRHDPSCPAGRSEDLQALQDSLWLASAGAGATRARPLTLGEAVALGARLRPAQRRRAVVHVREVGPGVLLRTVVVGTRAVAQAMSTVPTAARSA